MTGTTDKERHDGERPVEYRLRQALAARADEVTVIGLRPADPPGPHLRRLSVRALWRRRSTWAFVGLSGLAAAALAGYLVLGPDTVAPRPVPPAAPPELTSPSPTPTPKQTPTPTPSRPSTSPAPGAVPSPSATPSGQAGPSRMPPSGTAGSSSSPTPSRAPATTPASSVPPSTTSPSAAKPFPTPSPPPT